MLPQTLAQPIDFRRNDMQKFENKTPEQIFPHLTFLSFKAKTFKKKLHQIDFLEAVYAIQFFSIIYLIKLLLDLKGVSKPKLLLLLENNNKKTHSKHLVKISSFQISTFVLKQ